MRGKVILIAFIAVIILAGYSLIREKGFVIKEASSENWRFTSGELLFKGGEEEIKYSIDYKGNEEFEPIGLTFDFSICPKNNSNEDDIKNAEHLYSDINVYSGKIDNKYSKRGSFKGKLLNQDKEYNFENLYLKISYTAGGKDYEEVIKLPMEKR